MKQAYIEHANITVSDPDATAAVLCQIFDWKIRWSGSAMDGGYSVHVGGQNSYLAIYTNNNTQRSEKNNHNTVLNLNHIGIVVDDLVKIEAKVSAAGFKPKSHQQYLENASSFYFYTLDELEIEVICYSA